MTIQTKTGILLMAHGAPESLGDIAPYLGHIMKGRMPSQEVINQIQERYRLVGGKSPLLEITRRLAERLENRLNQETARFRVYIGMRHWHPFIHEVVKQIMDDPPDQLLAISLAPQYSRMSVGAYNRALEAALADASGTLPIRTVASWHDQPFLLDAFAKHLRESLATYTEKVRSGVQILFTAHSLPAEILKDGDPYPKEVMATVQGIVDRLDLGFEGERWRFAYQSRGFRRGEWLKPEVDEVIDDLSNRGEAHLLVVPIGFVSDHVEILYDIDILYKGMAASKGISLKRTASLNTAPLFVEALASVVHASLPIITGNKRDQLPL